MMRMMVMMMSSVVCSPPRMDGRHRHSTGIAHSTGHSGAFMNYRFEHFIGRGYQLKPVDACELLY